MLGPVITFIDRDIRRGGLRCDESMIISVLAAEYKIERCQGAFYGFAGERVPIKEIVELETTFGDRSRARTIPVLYTVVDAEASYNIIIGRPTLNKLEAVVSTHHFCMKFLAGRTDATFKVESTAKNLRVNVLDFDLDPRHFSTEERPHPVRDLKEVQIGPLDTQITKIGKTLGQEGKDRLVKTLRRNVDVFAWSAKDMPSIDPNFMCHHLSISSDAKPVAQKKRKQGEEK
ncbi:hypothetical protein CR513_60963, partial [Mucuna pruriens]